MDSTLGLLRDGYRFIGKRCRRLQSDAFATRLMLQPAVCMLGAEAAEAFYAVDRFTRQGAMPAPTLRLLQDFGSVATLDGAAHRQRKQMFLSLMTPEAIARLVALLAREWEARLARWESQDVVVLDEETRDILCRAVCAWSGIPLTDEEARWRTHELGAMIDGAGTVGPRNWWGWLLRERSERWAREVIRAVRRGGRKAPAGSAVQVIASQPDHEGIMLEPGLAAVELLNVLRPTVAVSRYVTFVALALHEYPEWRERVSHDDEARRWFVQEVRRYYPFFPFVAGCVREPFTWRGHRFARGRRVLLDLYGTNHDARIWHDPDVFRPERFRDRDGSAYDFIPQGGGGYDDGHRCPGEWITIALMNEAARLLTTMRYHVPAQDLGIDLSRMPAAPQSRFVITNVRRADTAIVPEP